MDNSIQRPDIPQSPAGINGRLPRFHVVLHDCNCHSQDLVQQALCHYLGMPPNIAFQKMMGVHMLGKSILITTHHEAAEHYKTLLEYGAINHQGAGLIVTLEPAD
jgi:ATP-dependent Clp protease adapter protein ClpS